MNFVFNTIGECGALWGNCEQAITVLHRQHDSYVYTACCSRSLQLFHCKH